MLHIIVEQLGFEEVTSSDQAFLVPCAVKAVLSLLADNAPIL